MVKRILRRGVFTSYSQFGEDMVARALLRGVKRGVYVDVGCADPVLYSNTYHFYAKGWQGTCVDPNPVLAGRYRLMRPRDTFLQAGVGEGTASYQTFQDAAYNALQPGGDLALVPLSVIIGTTKVDLLTVDAEGMDLQVLQSHDWRNRPTVVIIESEQGSVAQQLLESNGYQLRGVCGLSLIFKLV